MRILIFLSLFSVQQVHAFKCWYYSQSLREVKSRLFGEDFQALKHFDYNAFYNYQKLLKNGDYLDLTSNEARVALIEHVSFSVPSSGMGFETLLKSEKLSKNQRQAIFRATNAFNKKGIVIEKRLDNALKDFYLTIYAENSDLQSFINLWDEDHLKYILAQRLREQSLKKGIMNFASNQGDLKTEPLIYKKFRKFYSRPKISLSFNLLLNYMAIKSGTMGFFTPAKILKIEGEIIDYFLKHGVDEAVAKYFPELKANIQLQYQYDLFKKYWNNVALLALIGTVSYKIYDDVHVSDEELEEGDKVVDEIEESVEILLKELEQEIDDLDPKAIRLKVKLEKAGVISKNENFMVIWREVYNAEYPNKGNSK